MSDISFWFSVFYLKREMQMDPKSHKPLQSLKRKRLPEEIAGQLKDSIFSGQYKLGDKLPYESELCEIFGVGRTVVREALRSLENSGLIAVKRGYGGGLLFKKPVPRTSPIPSRALSARMEGVEDARVLFGTFQEGTPKLFTPESRDLNLEAPLAVVISLAFERYWAEGVRTVLLTETGPEMLTV